MDKSTNSQLSLAEVTNPRREMLAVGYTDKNQLKEMILVVDLFKGTISFEIYLAKELHASAPKIATAFEIYNSL